jgi:zinc protease
MSHLSSIDAQKNIIEMKKDNEGFTYEIVKGDNSGVRIYTLSNGLKIYLAQNSDEPRIQTYIPVRTGSNNDPKDNTGLAHYLEHMLFKGTSKIGTKDWDSESKLISQISDLYEQHKAESDAQKKQEIYKKIDLLSQEASKFSIANEYDKLISTLGTKGTNAHTWLNETVYKNNIPSNELEKWLMVEKERFSKLVLRLFHTELETVYEEFNRAQDNDARLVNYALMDALFPLTPYGQQTTIGKPEHLKNPSMVAIHKYFDTYYVPNNMAIILVGDLDFDKTIKMVNQYFGDFQYRELPKKSELIEKPQSAIVKREVKSHTAERLSMAWRTSGVGSRESLLVDICSNILSNSGEVGLLDTNVNQKQLALYANSYNITFNDYGYQSVNLSVKEGQTLEEGEKIILTEIEKIKKGAFDESIIQSIVNNKKLDRMKRFETSDGLATVLYNSFIQDRSWNQVLSEIEDFASITKEEIVKFANSFYKDNYAIVYKRKGINDKLVRVVNPGITPVELNRDSQSEFHNSFLKISSAEITPVFVDYNKEIQTHNIDNTQISFVKNKTNTVGSLYYIFKMGSDHNKKLSFAMSMLDYFGTNEMSLEEIKKEFYKIGITYSARVLNDLTYISLTGLEDNLPKGIDLFENFLQNIKPDQDIFKKSVETVLNNRENAKKRKENIVNGLINYAKYGKESRFRDVLPKAELQSMNPSELTGIIKNLTNYEHEIFFYGSNLSTIIKSLEKRHNLKANIPIPNPKVYLEPETKGKVYFTNYDMVQTEMTRIAKGKSYNLEISGLVDVFNSYFGSGLSSIVFQEIRESKSLAYSAGATYRMAPEKNLSDYMQVSVGTQANKLPQAVDALSSLLNEMPKIEKQFNNALASSLKQIASTRIIKTNLYFTQLNLKKLGFDYDIRSKTYNQIKNLNITKLNDFFNQEVKTKHYNTAIIGKKENLDFEALKRLGTIEELTLEEIFNY